MTSKTKIIKFIFAAIILIIILAAGFLIKSFRSDTSCGPWNWTQTLNADDVVSAIPWNNNGNMAELSNEQIETLVFLLNNLEKEDFIENTKLVGGTPEYGLLIKTSDYEYSITESIDPRGALETCYVGEIPQWADSTPWWIDNDELAEFVENLVFESFGQAQE